MAIKFSQFNERTDHTSGMYLVGYDGNQNIHITVDNLFDDFINGTENTIAMFGTGGNVLADSILSQDANATEATISGVLTVTDTGKFEQDIEVEGTASLFGNVSLGDDVSDSILQAGTLAMLGPVKDKTDTLGAIDQVLLSDAAGKLTFTDLSGLHVGGAEVVEVPVKNTQGSALVKGDPVYISGSVGASGRLEVQLADASNTLKMPAVGLLKQDLADNAEGFAVVTGKLRNLITDPIDGVTPTENDVIYVKPSGTSGAALTTTKPVYGNFIQNVGKVGRVSSGNSGNFVVSSILRTNDIPNLTPGRLWIGSTGNTIESQTIFVDEANGRVGIDASIPSEKLDVSGAIRSSAYEGRLVLNSTAPSGKNYELSSLEEGALGLFDGTAYRLWVSGSGNVGIGATNPANGKLAVQSPQGSNQISVKTNVSTDGRLHIGHFSNGTFIGTYGDDGGAGDIIRFGTHSGDERMRIDSSGDVGIGTPLPDGLLHVSSGTSGDAVVIIESDTDNSNENDNPHVELRQDGGGIKAKLGIEGNAGNTYSNSVSNATYLGTVFEQPLQFITGNTGGVQTAKMTINPNSGNVGIGTISPTAKLEIDGNLVFTNDTNSITFGGVTSSPSLQITNSSTLSTIQKVGSGVLKLESQPGIQIEAGGYSNVIDSSGRWGIGTTTPSKKLHVNGSGIISSNLAIGSTNTTGTPLRVVNSNAGTTGAIFESTNMMFSGTALEVHSTSNSSVQLIKLRSVNTDRFIIGGLGQIGVGGTNYGISGQVLTSAGSQSAPSWQSISNPWTTSGNNIYNNNSGNVGINTATPDYTLDVAGNAGFDEYLYHNGDSDTNIRFTSNNIYLNAGGTTGVRCESTKTTIATFHQFESDGDFAIGDTVGINSGTSMHCDGSNIQVQSGAGLVYFQTGVSSNYFSGNLGIGTTNPQSKLHVSGNALRVENPTAGSSNFAHIRMQQKTVMGSEEVHLMSDSNSNFYISNTNNLTSTDRSNTFLGSLTSTNNTYNGNDCVFEATNSNGPQSNAVTMLFKANTDSQTGPYNEVGIEVDRQDGWPFSSTKRGKMRLQTGGNDHITMSTFVSEFGSGTSTTFNQVCTFSALSSGFGFFNGTTATFAGKVGVGINPPVSKLDVNGGIRMADDTSAAASTNVGTLRYRTSGNNSYVDMCMQTGATTYAWVNIVTNNW